MTSRASRYTPWIALCLAALVARVLLESRAALREGQDHIARGDIDRGVTSLRRAAHLYLPGSPYVSDAYDALESIARQSETRGQGERALLAWRAVRSSALATRWITVPYADRLARANRHIAHRMAEAPASPDERERSVSAREEQHLALLSEDRAPEPAWRVVLALGLALWLAAMLHAARSGWDDDDRPRPRSLGAAALAGSLGAALLLVALWRA